MRESHAEAMQLGLPCPYDCSACESAALRHRHTFTCCGVTTGCYGEDCETEHLPECAACMTRRIVGRVRIPSNLPLGLDPWTGRVYRSADLDSIPF